MFKAWKWWSRESLNGYFYPRVKTRKHLAVEQKVWWPKSPKKIDFLIVIHCLLLTIFGIFTEVRGLWPAPTPCPEFWHCNCNRSITCPTIRGKGWQSGYMFLSMTSRIPPVSAPCTASWHMPNSWPNSSQTAERTPRFPKWGALRTLFEQWL